MIETNCDRFLCLFQKYLKEQQISKRFETNKEAKDLELTKKQMIWN